MAKHYILTEESGRVLRGFSDDFEQPDASAICINEDGGRHFELNGVISPIYNWTGGTVGKSFTASISFYLDARL